MPSHFSFGKVLNKQILWKVRYHFRSMHHFCRSHFIEIVRDPFPGKNFKSYQPQHEIWAFQCLKKAWQTNAKKKKKTCPYSWFPALCGNSEVYFATNKSAEVGCTWPRPNFIQSEYCRHSGSYNDCFAKLLPSKCDLWVFKRKHNSWLMNLSFTHQM